MKIFLAHENVSVIVWLDLACNLFIVNVDSTSVKSVQPK